MIIPLYIIIRKAILESNIFFSNRGPLEVQMSPLTQILLFLVMDIGYITQVVGPVAKIAVRDIQNSPMKLRMDSTILAYLLMVFSYYYLIIRDRAGWKKAAVLGATTYGVFAFTNRAIFNGWTWQLVLMDLIWGMVLYGGLEWVSS